MLTIIINLIIGKRQETDMFQVGSHFGQIASRLACLNKGLF